MKKTFVAAALAALFATPTLADSSCLELVRVWNWNVLDNKTLVVEDEIHQKFKLTLMGYCPNLTFKERLGFRVIGGSGLSCISRGDEVISRDIGMNYHCPITQITPYTADMEKADKAVAAAKAAQP